MRVNNIKVHEKAEIQQAEIKSSTKLVVPMTDDPATRFANPPTVKGELIFDTSNNHLFIGDISDSDFQWVKINMNDHQ